MKKLKKLIVLIAVLFISLMMNGTVYAVESEQDGLVVEITTDQQNYQQGEEISAVLTIHNTNEDDVDISKAEIHIPKGFTLQQSAINQLEDQQLLPDETIEIKTKLIPTNETVLDSSDTNQTKESISVNTGTSQQPVFIMFLLLLISFSVCILLMKKQKKYKNLLLMILMLALSVSTLLTNVQASENNSQITIEKTIQYGNKVVTLQGSVTYSLGSQSPKDPVTYQDNVKETYMEYSLDEEQKQVITKDLQVKEWNAGEIHVLKNSEDEYLDIAIKIDSIETREDGTIIISYDIPAMQEVVKDIHYAGENTEEGRIFAAEGVTLIEDETNSYSRAMPAMDIGGSGYMGLFKTYQYSKNVGGIEIGGKLTLEKIRFAFDINLGLFHANLNKASVILDSNVTVNLDSNSDFSGEKKIKIASFESYIGYGFFAVGDIYVRISASGEVTVEYKIETQSGFDYQKGKFKGIMDIDHKLTKAKAEAKLQLAASAEPKVEFLKMGLVGGEFVYGRNFELTLDNISLKPIEYCLDAGYHNFAEISSILLPNSKFEQKFTANLMDKDDSVVNRYLHIEEKGIVDECTRKYGSLSGTVLKHDGNENIPLYLANVALEKDGKEKYTIKTDGKGKFQFDKTIEKGTYDLIVSSKYYETYKGKIKIIGNKENSIGEIVLEPYAESVTVSGMVYDNITKNPIANASVVVKGYDTRKTQSDEFGNYTLEVPIGSQEIIVSAAGYKNNAISDHFSETKENVNIGLFLDHEINVLTIHAGESYQFDYTGNAKIFFKAEEPTTYSSYHDGNANYRKTDYVGEFYIPGTTGKHLEVKVFSGALMVFVSENFDSTPIADLNSVCNYSNMNGIDPFIDYTISAGQSKTFDNQINQPKNASYKVYFKSKQAVIGTETITDYYYNENYGWNITENIYDLKGIIQQWRPINCLEKVRITITSGEVIAYYYRLDPITTY